MSDKGTTRIVAETLGDVFAPLVDAFGEGGDPVSFFQRLGWFVTAVPKPYKDLAVVVSGIVDKVAASRGGTADNAQLVGQIIDGVVAIHGAIGNLPAPTGVDATKFLDGLASKVVQLLVSDYLSLRVPTLFNALSALGIIVNVYHSEQVENDVVVRPAFVERQILYGEIPAVLTDPASIPQRVVGWGTPNLRFDDLAHALYNVFEAVGLSAGLFPVDKDWRDGFGADLDNRDTMSVALRLSLAEAVLGDTPVDVTLALLDAPAEPGHPLPGVVLQPLIPSFTETIPVGAQTSLTVKGGLETNKSFGLFLRPKEDPEIRFPFAADGAFPDGGVQAELIFAPPAPSVLLGQKTGSRVEVTGAALRVKLESRSGKFQVAAEAEATGLNAVIAASEGDGFIAKLLAGKTVKVELPSGIRWSNVSGVSLIGAAGFEITLAAVITLGPLIVQNLKVAVRAGASGQHPALRANFSADLSATLGPVAAAVQDVGVGLTMTFEPGNVGPFDLGVGFKAPTGVGISVNGGAISGGGFLAFAPGKYSGAIELEAYSISIKAFGLIETGAAGAGFSFVIVISTEFATPIQLGLGFTLNGVGGMIGINRTVNSDALRALVVAGRTENLLFPKNVIANAPAIIRDLGTVFPAREGHYVFGPLAKLGWGTPTLITAELALILELPGPVLFLIGEVKCLLPKPEVALVKFNMSIAGQLDFPHKTFSLDAALHDSVIEGYPVSGQMAMRLRWGEQPNFALSIGGFHPAYQPPPNFPKLQPMTVALAQQGSTSVTVSGFFALTSNTLQIGGEARLHAGGSGISLDASIAVKTIFIFSPFSFAANIDASVKISFHGHGPSVHLSGVLSGPSPWRAKGEVCVSILWWDACLRFDQTFGGTTTVPEPVLDPWLGSATVQGLKGALQDAKNWAALPPAGSFAVVSRAAGANDLVDPLGGFTVRQKAVPVETALAIARFGPARAAEPNRTGPIFFNGATGSYGTDIPLAQADVLKDFFAPAQFFELNDAKKLSAKSFDKYGSGYSFAINARNIEAGSIGSRQIQYTTKILGSGGTVTDPQLYDLPPAHLAAKSATSAVAKGGFAQSGSRRYIDPAFTQPFAINDVGFTLASADSLQAVTPGAPPLPRADALVALDDYIALHPEKRGQVQVVATYELAA